MMRKFLIITLVLSLFDPCLFASDMYKVLGIEGPPDAESELLQKSDLFTYKSNNQILKPDFDKAILGNSVILNELRGLNTYKRDAGLYGSMWLMIGLMGGLSYFLIREAATGNNRDDMTNDLRFWGGVTFAFGAGYGIYMSFDMMGKDAKADKNMKRGNSIINEYNSYVDEYNSDVIDAKEEKFNALFKDGLFYYDQAKNRPDFYKKASERFYEALKYKTNEKASKLYSESLDKYNNYYYNKYYDKGYMLYKKGSYLDAVRYLKKAAEYIDDDRVNKLREKCEKAYKNSLTR